MKKQIHTLRLLILTALAALPVVASAGVSASPAFYDFGAVPAGRTMMTTIYFFNSSPAPVQYFNVNCNGDFSAFSCFSMCSYLPAYGSCSVQVQFTARSGDNQRKVLWVSGNGSGNFATATVYATDRKKP